MAGSRKGVAAAVVVVAVLLVAGFAVVRLSLLQHITEQRAKGREVTAPMVQSMQQKLGAAAAAVQMLAYERSIMTGSTTQQHAAHDRMLPEGLEGTVFLAAPQAERYRITVLEGEAAQGDVEHWAENSLASGEEVTNPIWSDPIRAVSGEWTLMVHAAVPGRGSDAAPGEWVVAGIPLDSVLASSGARAVFDSGFDYQFVTMRNAATRRVRGSTDSALQAPLEWRIVTASGPGGQQWLLRVAPREGWFGWTALLGEIVLVVTLALFSGLVAYDVARRSEGLRIEVETRDRRLREVHARLDDEIERREELEQRFSYASFHDALTGLPNRAYFMERLGRALQRARLRSGFVAVIVVNFDKFRSLRETLGGGAGDDLLTQAVQRLQSELRPEDLAVARLADDQFGMLLFEIGSEEAALSAARRLQGAFAEPFRIAAQHVFASASMGIALSSSGYEDADELLQGAQMALSKAGESGLALFDAATREQLVTRHQLETDLHQAITRQEFILHYQPIVSLSTGKVAGMEALLRWRHPLEGMVSPARFIPLAEETGLIVPITRWTLREACRQARIWRDQLGEQSDFYISVNLSAQDLRQPDICDYVTRVNAEAGLPLGVLRLEVTESMMIGNFGAVSELLARFRNDKFPLLLDDFGTGYSSLSYLNRFQFDYIKIDRAFVSRMTSPESSGIVRAIVHLAQDLATKTIAEGVETESEVKQLQELGCDFAQGFYFSKPLEASLAQKLLLSSWQRTLSLQDPVAQ